MYGENIEVDEQYAWIWIDRPLNIINCESRMDFRGGDDVVTAIKLNNEKWEIPDMVRVFIYLSYDEEQDIRDAVLQQLKQIPYNFTETDLERVRDLLNTKNYSEKQEVRVNFNFSGFKTQYFSVILYDKYIYIVYVFDLHF
jgi:hypothetical protein